MNRSRLLGAVPRAHLEQQNPRWRWFFGHLGPHWTHVVAYYEGTGVYGAVLANDNHFILATEGEGGHVWLSPVAADPETLVRLKPFWAERFYKLVCTECLRWHCNCLWAKDDPDPVAYTDAEVELTEPRDDELRIERIVEQLANETEES